MCFGKSTCNIINAKMFNTKRNKSKKSETNKQVPKLKQDVLALSTIYTKKVLFTVGDFIHHVENSTFFRILSNTTQPAHVIAILGVIFVFFLLVPSENKVESPLLTLIYLGSFSAHFGAQIWMTFISGLALYFSMPRHTFGSIQMVLFPKYFLLNSILSLITLTVFVNSHNDQMMQTDVIVQTFGMILCFMTELMIRLYYVPPFLHLISVKTQIESDAGVGEEIGQIDPKELLKCDEYLHIHNLFRRGHMTIAVGNIISISCTILHLIYLSQKLCIIV